MHRLYLLILLLAVGAPLAVAQDAESEPADDTQAEEETAAPEEKVTDEEIEELLGLDEDYTEAEDDDYEASQEVSFDQPLRFPTDI